MLTSWDDRGALPCLAGMVLLHRDDREGDERRESPSSVVVAERQPYWDNVLLLVNKEYLAGMGIEIVKYLLTETT